MRIKLRITNQSGKKIAIRFEPTGDYKYLSQKDEIVIELEKRNEGRLVDLIIDENLDVITWVENNDIFVEHIE